MDLNATLPGKDEEDVNFIEEAAELMMSKMLSVRTRTDEMGRASLVRRKACWAVEPLLRANSRRNSGSF